MSAIIDAESELTKRIEVMKALNTPGCFDAANPGTDAFVEALTLARWRARHAARVYVDAVRAAGGDGIPPQPV